MNGHEHPVERFVRELVEEWNEEIRMLGNRGLVEPAKMMESMIRDLYKRMQEWLDEEMTLRDAAEFTGLSYSTIQAQARSGELMNVGKKGSPRVRRRDLPYRGLHGADPEGGDETPPPVIFDDDPDFDLVDLRLIKSE